VTRIATGHLIFGSSTFEVDFIWLSVSHVLQELGGVTSKWTRRSFVEKAGWAKMPGEETSNSNLADACAQALKELAGA